MLRINLLPPYVTQRRLTKRLIPVFALLVALSVALPLVAYISMKNHLADLTQQAETAEAQKNANDALEASAKSTLAQVQPILDKLKFVQDVHAFDRAQVALFNTLADKSPRNSFIYSGVTSDAGYNTLTIKAYSPSVEEVGRYLQAMYQEPDFSSVVVDKIPGYPDNVQHRWYLGKTMVFADGASASGGAGGGGGYPGGGGGGYPGGGGNRGGGYPGGGGGYPGGGGGTSAASNGPPGYTPAALGPNGPSNVPPGVGPPPPELTGGIPTAGATAGGGYPGGTGGAGGGYPGGGGQAGGYSPNFLRVALAGVSPFAPPDVQDRILKNALRRVRMVTIPKGFDITVIATVKQPPAPLTPPTPPGSAPAATPGGAGSYPGGGGGYPGGGYPGGRPTG